MNKTNLEEIQNLINLLKLYSHIGKAKILKRNVVQLNILLTSTKYFCGMYVLAS